MGAAREGINGGVEVKVIGGDSLEDKSRMYDRSLSIRRMNMLVMLVVQEESKYQKESDIDRERCTWQTDLKGSR